MLYPDDDPKNADWLKGKNKPKPRPVPPKK